MAIFFGVPVTAGERRVPNYYSFYGSNLPRKEVRRPTRHPSFAQVNRARRFQVRRQKLSYPKLTDLGL